MNPRTLIGLDLGQVQDFTAMAVLERSISIEPTYGVRHLKHWPPGTGYPTIVEEVAQLVKSLPPIPWLGVDVTGVGRSVLNLLLRKGLQTRLYPITITAGHSLAGGPDGISIPKKELVSALQVLFQTRRLKVANTLPEARILVAELSNFKAKLTTNPNDMMVAWREGAHDDLVLAVAMAAWMGESVKEPYTGPLVYWPEVPGPADDQECASKVIYESNDGDFAIVRVHGQDVVFDDNELRDPWTRR